MTRRSLESLVSEKEVWLSRKGLLHEIKDYSVTQRYINIYTTCGESFSVRNSRRGRASRVLRNNKYRKICKHCKVPDEKISKFLQKASVDSTAKVKVVSSTKPSQSKKAVPKAVKAKKKGTENSNGSLIQSKVKDQGSVNAISSGQPRSKIQPTEERNNIPAFTPSQKKGSKHSLCLRKSFLIHPKISISRNLNQVWSTEEKRYCKNL